MLSPADLSRDNRKTHEQRWLLVGGFHDPQAPWSKNDLVYVFDGETWVGMEPGDAPAEEEYDPHVWFDAELWIYAARTVRDRLIELVYRVLGEAAHAERGITSLHLTGGEPTVHARFTDTLALARSPRRIPGQPRTSARVGGKVGRRYYHRPGWP